VILTTHPQCRG